MATLQVGDARVGYAVEGGTSGIPLLLFHGTTQDRTGWSMPTGPISTDDLVAQALAVMDHLGHERFHVAGYSLGAVAALAVAAAVPARVASVTSLCGWVTTDARMRFTFGLWQRLIALDPELFMRYAVADGFTAAAIGGLEPMLEDIVAMGSTAIQPGSHAQLDLDAVVDLAPLLASITSPTLIIGAVEDRWVDISHSRQLAAAIPGAKLAELPAGHVVIQELAPEVAMLVDTFVGGIE